MPETTGMIRVYIAGPYTEPDPAVNTARAMEAWHDLADHGFVPFCPHLSHFLHIHRARPYEEWMEHDKAWLHQCDAMLRLPGKSAGADKKEAEFQGPVFHSVSELLTWKWGLQGLQVVGEKGRRRKKGRRS